MAFSDVPLKYVNAIGFSAQRGGYEISNVKAHYLGGFPWKWITLILVLWFGSNTESDAFGAGYVPDDGTAVLAARVLAVVAIFTVVVAAFLFGYAEGQRSYHVTVRDLSERTASAERMMNFWAMVMPRLQKQSTEAVAGYDRQLQLISARRQEIERTRKVLGEFVDLRQHAEAVTRRALDEATFHCDEECPMRCPIFLREGDGLWHLYPRCSSPANLEPANDVMTQLAACPECAQEWMTPYVPNRDGTSLATAIEHYLEVSERTHGLW